MRPLGVAIAVLGLVAAATTILALRSGIVGGEPGSGAAMAVTGSEASDGPPPKIPHRAPARVRPVAPAHVALPAVEPEMLERVEEREPLSPIGRAQAPSEGPPKATMLPRPLAVSAGVFQSLGHTVALAGIAALDAGEQCASDGIEWPCGVHARTAFRNWLRGRALTCVVPAVPAVETVVTDCTLGRQNPAEWLVTYGWAKALPDSPYAELEDAARAAGRGIFGPAPSVPQPLAITVPDLSGPDVPAPILLDADPSGG